MALQQLQDIYLATTTTPGEKPAAGQLQLGELAFNAADRLGFLGPGVACTTSSRWVVRPRWWRAGHAWPCGACAADAGRHLGGHHAHRPPELNIWNGVGWVVLAKPDGVTLISNPVTGVLQADTLDMGIF